MGTGPDFDGWVAARGPSLLRLAYLLTGDAREAEDLVDDALARALPRWSRISRSPDPDAAVRRLVVATHLSRWRAFRRRHAATGDVLDRRQPELGQEVGVELRDAVWDACASLAADELTAVVLRFYEGLRPDEIADLTGDSESNVHSLLAGGLTSLNTALAQR